MNFQYEMSNIELEVYVGKLNKDVNLVEEVNKLYWMDKKENFFDLDKFAGEGNIGHMVQQVEIYKNKLFQEDKYNGKSHQFESIHPFLDGNGRIGRLLIPLYIQSKGILDKSCLYISDYIERNKDTYYDMLTRVMI